MSNNYDILPSIGLTHIRRKTVVSLLRTWREVKSTAAEYAGNREIRPSVPKGDTPHLHAQMELCLNSPGGEVTARAHTAELGLT